MSLFEINLHRRVDLESGLELDAESGEMGKRGSGKQVGLIGWTGTTRDSVGIFPFSPADQQLLSMQRGINIWLATTAAAIIVIKRYGPADSI